ncbi:sigma-70 family RNA polymerase sigma factor [Streptomyces sp. NPDC048389]|uniref:sigma-70 family RNA polymerase sigma factor n=1 Tax=Streptomyces sp. NPDC048389 TaxID=3154622 RepID=UPI003451C686
MRRRHDSHATLHPAAQVPRPPVPESTDAATDGGTVSGSASADVTTGGSAQTAADPDGLEREVTVSRLFDLHYSSMLRLAALLGADDPENIVAEAYYQIYRKWRKLRDTEAAEAYLRSTVCNLTRMRIRHLQVVRRHAEIPPADVVASAESSALLRADQRVLIGALQRLPARQREALVLRHWLGLKESEIAAAMGISAGSVKTHTSRGIAALTQAMEARR